MITKGIHQALGDFRWLVDDLGKRHTRLYNLVPLHTTLDGYHYDSGYMLEVTFIHDTTAAPG